MPLAKLDTNAALIVIDLQKGIVVIPTVHPAGEIIGRAAQLARAFRERSLPVVLVNVTGRAPGRTGAETPTFSFPADLTELVAELDQHPDDYLTKKDFLQQRLGLALKSTLSPTAGKSGRVRTCFGFSERTDLIPTCALLGQGD